MTDTAGLAWLDSLPLERLHAVIGQALAARAREVEEVRAVIAEARARFSRCDEWLQQEFGGFYESAPSDSPLGEVRATLRGRP